MGTSNNQQVYRFNTATGAKLIPEMWFLSISLNGAVTSGPVGGGMISSLAQPVASLADRGGPGTQYCGGVYRDSNNNVRGGNFGGGVTGYTPSGNQMQGGGGIGSWGR